jgi:peptidoglycan hydrolase-like protein with peptidoglycan-binding domain
LTFTYPGSPVKKGSKGDAVKLVQAIVGANPQDGDFGPGTEGKVKAWQTANGLTADGVIGPVTWKKMFGG